MITRRPRFLITIWLILVIFTLIFVTNSYFFGKDVAAGRKSYEKKITTLEQELDRITEAKKAKQSETNSGDSSDCASTLTSSDELEINLWNTYENSAHKVSFRYPQTWTASEGSDDSATFTDDEALLNFQFGVKSILSLDNSGYEVEKEENVTIACEKATKTIMVGLPPGGENFNRISTEFTKGNTDYVVVVTYRYVGASISGDIVEAYNLILKTTEFD